MKYTEFKMLIKNIPLHIHLIIIQIIDNVWKMNIIFQKSITFAGMYKTLFDELIIIADH